ncbi:MAG: 50S ribosomal protein L11 methyltransferase [Fusobacterium mortiferum]|jgi:ribosomal protein L11 methyltransferase|uniref:Ribosomal protein L11 methyltransferase n=2 Tax=Fusobacterium mortiferum TaxID=850 RepID=A0A414Q0B1_FUSMR|nr:MULTISPECIES: 50S ribosomal protein L11 methyltransferase [Fusobacterium]AVQ18331.1 50S ribosomal protein L11 methyltransferase [Fusobacterium mortiferum ATCC 9817]EEO34565.1 ribosomal protein L11 methyltransferase [Fusobacterium mortiferum ATCC 9817]MCF2626595.1 50S ribosomal protein L11 methyltransferase [Fusobacterium mortiferum]MCF2699096.1 50S ribosomal protein L11 methyltransferase [Fusobacterium mortiferum]MCI6381443.1 50S ribosomal protein L11 methyltransferase [Fusobacterium mortif
MKVVEIKVIYESDDIERATKEISDIFYGFGVTGLKIEEPMKSKNPLDFYKNEKEFLMVDHAISAYFPLNPYAEKRKMAILSTFEEKFADRDDIIYTVDFYEYDEEDYQNSWKKYLFPEKVSEKFVVKPTWREYTPEADELIIELDPGRAFGTGSHPTTSLCLKLMEENISEGDSVIDVGTGSGILMIAADRLGASEIYGTDIDELAVESAKENLELNKISEEKAKVYKGDLISVVENKKFDVVVANILADVLLILLHDISKVVKPNGKIIFSGIIEDKCELLKREVESLGFTVEEIKADKEWRAMLIKA